MKAAQSSFGFDGRPKSRSVIQPAVTLRDAGEPAAEVDRRVGDLLEQAISRRLENNPEPAALLSGGIDSTLICQIAARQLAERDQRLRA